MEELFRRKAKEDGDREHLALLAEDLNSGILLWEPMPLSAENLLENGVITDRVSESLASLRVVQYHQKELDELAKAHNPRDRDSVEMYQERLYSLLGRNARKDY